MPSMKTEIKSYSYEGLQRLMKDLGVPSFRTAQLVQWLYQKHATSYEDMTNLPKQLRATLSEEAPLYAAKVVDKQISSDGTRKYIIAYEDGCMTETVAIPSRDRLTVCFSTQVGCAMSCAFCATGKEGFSRNLLPGEMVEQVLIAQEDMGMRVSNLVGMGQGEPFLNYESVLAALRFINSKDGLNIGARHIAVSTCGVLKGIEAFGHEPEQFTLAISLHSALQVTRDALMPKMERQPLRQLKNAIRSYQKNSGRRVTFEYLLIDGVNDDEDHLEALVKFCKGLMCHINIITLNKVDDALFQPSEPAVVQWFLEGLQNAGIEATLRESRGKDIAGACGQLKNITAARS